jgi:hypothetical protein
MLHLFSPSSVHTIKGLVLRFVIKSMKLSPLSQWNHSNLQRGLCFAWDWQLCVCHGALFTYDIKNYSQYLGLLSSNHNESQGTLPRGSCSTWHSQQCVHHGVFFSCA